MCENVSLKYGLNLTLPYHGNIIYTFASQYELFDIRLTPIWAATKWLLQHFAPHSTTLCHVMRRFLKPKLPNIDHNALNRMW